MENEQNDNNRPVQNNENGKSRTPTPLVLELPCPDSNQGIRPEKPDAQVNDDRTKTSSPCVLEPVRTPYKNIQ